MSTIGGITVTFLRGQLMPTAETVEDITRPGKDGHAYRWLGERSEPQMLASLADVTGLASATATCTAYRALQGSLVTVVDDFGDTRANVMVQSVSGIRFRKIASAAGGLHDASASYIVSANWQFQTTG